MGEQAPGWAQNSKEMTLRKECQPWGCPAGVEFKIALLELYSGDPRAAASAMSQHPSTAPAENLTSRSGHRKGASATAP